MTQNNLLEEVRSKIGQSFQDESVCDEMYEKFRKADVEGNNLLLGYKGAIEMAKSKHANIFVKMSYFNTGKDILERAISKDTMSIELRYLRFQIQYNTPSFLGYKGQLKSDRDFISNNLSKVENETLRNSISAFLAKAEF